MRTGILTMTMVVLNHFNVQPGPLPIALFAMFGLGLAIAQDILEIKKNMR